MNTIIDPPNWTWSVAFKKRTSGRLLWVLTSTQNEGEASKQGRDLVNKRYPLDKYLEYGLSKTYVETQM